MSIYANMHIFNQTKVIQLDNFGFLVGAHSTAWRAVIRPQMAKMVLLEAKNAVFEVPLILVRCQQNLARIPGTPKKLYGRPTEPVPTGITEKGRFCIFPKNKNWMNIRFLSTATTQNWLKTDFYLRKGYFFRFDNFAQSWPEHG